LFQNYIHPSDKLCTGYQPGCRYVYIIIEIFDKQLANFPLFTLATFDILSYFGAG